MRRFGRLAQYAKTPAEALRFLYHLPKTLLLIHRLLMDKRVPGYAKCLPLAALVYVVFPIDLIRDIPFIGYADDVVVVYFLLKAFIGLCPKKVVEEHVARLSKRGKRSAERKASKE